jgi:D-2-hydroxyacid dehydrogenase (NADP+)
MKKSAVFMNVGRGNTVHEAHLIQSLKNKDIAGAVLDVFEFEPLDQKSELWAMENVVITPHCADRDELYLARTVDMFLQNAQLFIQNKPVINVVDKVLGY